MMFIMTKMTVLMVYAEEVLKPAGTQPASVMIKTITRQIVDQKFIPLRSFRTERNREVAKTFLGKKDITKIRLAGNSAFEENGCSLKMKILKL